MSLTAHKVEEPEVKEGETKPVKEMVKELESMQIEKIHIAMGTELIQVPNHTKCLVLAAFGTSENIEVARVPLGMPLKNNVLVHNYSCGLNFQDIMTHEGTMDHSLRPPFILGSELAGKVVRIGDDVTNLKVGDRVVALPEFKAWSEYTLCPDTMCFKIPESMSYQEAVAITTNGIVAHTLLFELGVLHPGKSILMHPSPGGVGRMVTQMAHTVSDITMIPIGLALKANEEPHVGDHYLERDEDYVSEVRHISPMGVDIVLDSQCGENFNKDYHLLKPMGKFILYGTQNPVTGETYRSFGNTHWWRGSEKVSPLKMYEDNKSICAFNLRHLLYLKRERSYIQRTLNIVFRMWEQGIIDANIDSTYSFEDIDKALHRMKEHNCFGKVLLDPRLVPDTPEAWDARANIFERCSKCQQTLDKTPQPDTPVLERMSE